MTKTKLVVLAAALALLGAGCDKKAEGESKTGPKAAAKAADDDGLGAKHGGTPTSREGQMFLLGVKVAQAAMINGRADKDLVARTFGAAKTIADITLQHKLGELPAPTGDRAKDGAAGLHYLLNGPGKELGSKISTDFGTSAVACYEMAIKLNMLPVVYIGDPKDTMGDTMAGVLERLSTDAKLPPTALGPMIAKLKARAPGKEVTDMVFDLNEKLPVTIGEIYEKDDK